MRIQIWSAALVALTLAAPACTENQLIGPQVALTPRFTHVPGLPAVRISEIHYDNVGTDAGEFIEVSGPAGTNLTGWNIVLYNGANGAAYDTDPLTGSLPNNQDNCDGRGVVVVNYPVNGIQNGSPDGVALVDASNHVVEFLSYEGTFTATTGPAMGTTSWEKYRATVDQVEALSGYDLLARLSDDIEDAIESGLH